MGKDDKDFKDLEKDFFEGADTGNGNAPSDAGTPVIDEKLIRSMRPSWQRNPYLAVVVILASLYFMYSMWSDFYFSLRYGILGGKPVDVGDVSQAVKQGKLEHNSYVTVHGIPWIQSMFFVPKRGRIAGSSGPIKGYYTYYILVDSDNRLIVESFSKRRKLPEKYSTKFTGRLMRLDRIPIGPTLRAFYYRNVEGLERDVRINPMPGVPYSKAELARMDHNRKELGKARPLFIDSDDKKYAPGPDVPVDIKVLYRGDAVFSFDSKFTVDSSIVLTAPSCSQDATQTGSLSVVYDVRTIHLPTGEVSLPPSGTKLLKIPYGTKVFVDASQEALKPDKEGVLYTTEPIPCTKTAGFTRRLRFRLRPYATKNGVYRWLAAHDIPFRPLDKKATPKDDRWNVLVRLSEEELQKYLKMPNVRKVCETVGQGPAATKQCNMAIAAMVVDPRWEFVMKVPFGLLRFMDGKLVIMRARTDFPRKYREATGTVELGTSDVPISRRIKILESEPPAENYVIPMDWVLALQFRQKMEIPADAYLLRTRTKPDSWGLMWTVPAELVLLLLLLFNLRALVKWWQEN